VIAKFPLSLN